MWTLFLGIIIGLAVPPFYKWIVKKVTKDKPMAYGRSMADVEKKETTTLLYALTAGNLFFFLANYVFNTDLKAFMQVAGSGWNIIGAVLHVASIGFLWFLAKKTDGHGNAGDNGGAVIVWLILLGFAIATSTGFNFDYFSLR